MSPNLLAVAIALTAVSVQASAAQDRGAMRFRGMDRNNDGVITRAEWRGNDRSFRVHDWNGDGVLSGDEVGPGARRGARQSDDWDAASALREYEFDDWTERGFNSVDRNRDNRITADEWHFNRDGFRRADHNGDGIISRREFLNEPAPGPARSLAYRAGYERGLTEGRAAGREDRERNQGWDLEGQRELEQADSGYDTRFGPRADYQAGYREGFRLGYPEGFGSR